MIDTCPGVPPVVFLEKKTIAVELQAVVATVTAPGVPDILPETPAEAFDPVGTIILLPAVPMTKLPLVAVMLPRVAVMLVPALTAPAVATIFPVVEVMPVPAVIVVPAVTVVPADTDPAVAAMLPKVAVMFPAETTALPVVTVSPVPAVNVVPEAKVVVVVNDPGVVIADGKETVATTPAVVTVT